MVIRDKRCVMYVRGEEEDVVNHWWFEGNLREIDLQVVRCAELWRLESG